MADVAAREDRLGLLAVCAGVYFARVHSFGQVDAGHHEIGIRQTDSHDIVIVGGEKVRRKGRKSDRKCGEEVGGRGLFEARL